eukprot:COSAG01_NODE_38240_length_492_cov_0.781170_1_plen_55_part_01
MQAQVVASGIMESDVDARVRLFTAHFHLYLQQPVPTPAAPWATGFTLEQRRRDAP